MNDDFSDDTRRIIAGGFADFLLHLLENPAPIIVGGGYPRDGVVASFNCWAAERNFNTTKGDLYGWRRACKQNKLGDPE